MYPRRPASAFDSIARSCSTCRVTFALLSISSALSTSSGYSFRMAVSGSVIVKISVWIVPMILFLILANAPGCFLVVAFSSESIMGSRDVSQDLLLVSLHHSGTCETRMISDWGGCWLLQLSYQNPKRLHDKPASLVLGYTRTRCQRWHSIL
jgi:hypothetical protein